MPKNILAGALTLTALDGTVLGGDSFTLDISAAGSEVVTADLFETLDFIVQLTPGVDYIMTSTLSAFADGAGFGCGFVDLRNTFEYVLSGDQVNPFADPNRQTEQSTESVDPNTVPEPPTALLLAFAMFGLVRLRRVPQRVPATTANARRSASSSIRGDQLTCSTGRSPKPAS